MRQQRVFPSAPPQELYSLAPPPYPGSPPPPVQPAFNPARCPTVTHVPPPRGGILSPQEAEVYEEIKDKKGAKRGFRLKPGKVYKKHNPQLYTKRGCTDILCCFLFLVFSAGWAVVAGIGLMWGDPERLITPTDSQGRRCGAIRLNSYNFTERPYLLYFDITSCLSYSTVIGGCQTTQICASECPTEYFSYLQLQTVTSGSDFMTKIQKNVYCTEDVDKNSLTSFAALKQRVQNKQCAAYTVKSAPVLGRCVPSVIVGAGDTLSSLQNVSLDSLKRTFGDDPSIPSDAIVQKSQTVVGNVIDQETTFNKIAHDLSKTWWQVLTMIGCAGILAFLWTIIMRILGGLMIWTSILAVLVGLGAGCAVSWIKWWKLKQAGAIDDYGFTPVFSVYFEMPTTWMVVAIVASVLLLIFVLVLILVRKRITIAVALISESSKAVGSMMSTLVFPIFPFILHLLVFALWGSIAIWLASSGQEMCRRRNADNTYSNCTCSNADTTCVFTGISKNEDAVFWLQIYNLFGFFWMSCFVTALGDIALAGAFASHYWAMDKDKDVPSFPVLRALARAVRYNLGSLAFGSLIIALVKIIRVMLDYLDKKLSKADNTVLKVIFGMLKCCFWCMEIFLKFLTKNAYIMMAIYGQNFFTSAKRSFLLLGRNIVRTVVVNEVAGILLFIGKAMITVGMVHQLTIGSKKIAAYRRPVGVVGFFYFSGQWVVKGIPTVELYYYFVPIIIVVIGSYFMADLFFDVYEMAVDTTFICFLEDSEQNDGSAEKPFYMSKRLQEILGKSNDPAKS